MSWKRPAWRAGAVLLIGGAAASAAVLARGCETERLLAEATRAEGSDDYEGAARRLREIVINHPESPLAAKAQLELAEIYLLRMRDVGAAHAALVKILGDYPSSPVAFEAHGLLARIYERETGELEKAIHQYRVVLASAPDVETERETLLALGDCHYRLEELEPAASAYEAAVALSYDPAADPAYLRLATLSRLAGNLEESLSWLDELVSRTRDPLRLHAARSLQAEVLLELGRYEEASERLAEAERLSPGAPENAELEARLDAARNEEIFPAGGEGSVEELEKRIRWGAGRRGRRQP